jgi:glycosyltransferase involved in cell wall biosynthesis
VKIGIIAPSPVPLVLGGAERLWAGLLRAFNETTSHDAELIKLPTREHTLVDLMASYQAFASLDLGHFDLVITTKYPAWMVRHDNHVLYVMHPLRGLYDTYHLTGLPTTVQSEEPAIRRLVTFLDRTDETTGPEEIFLRWTETREQLGDHHPDFAFPGPLAHMLVHRLDDIARSPRRIRRYLAISRTVASRPGYFPPGVPIQFVHPPSELENLPCGGQRYLFTASRLDGPKRLDLLIGAMRHVRGSTPLLIAGDGPLRQSLAELASADPRVQFLGYVSGNRLAQLYADALAVPFVPVDEDFGLIALEAMMAAKPVMTCRDSGGPAELVVHGVNGLIVDPTPAAVGEALQRFVSDPVWSRDLGSRAYDIAREVTWAKVVDHLTGAQPEPRAPRWMRHLTSTGRVTTGASRRPRLVVPSTFPVHPRRGGGQVRCYCLYGAMTPWFDVQIVSLGSPDDAAADYKLGDAARETVVPKGHEHQSAEVTLTARVGTPTTDVAASLFIDRSPNYLDALKEASRRADAVLLAHPFLVPAVDAVAPHLPVFYDAHNAEFALKDTIYRPDAIGDDLRQVVATVEGAATRRALLTFCCSAEDSSLLTHHYTLPPKNVVVIPNGVDLDGTNYVDSTRRALAREGWLRRLQAEWAADSRFNQVTRVALFIGSWHAPNLDAAEVIFSLAAKIPDLLFVLAGNHGEAYRWRRLPLNVLVLGEVGDTTKTSLLGLADVALNPMLRGSGTNLKIVEYAAAGAPVISTPLGARGTAFEPGVHVTVAAVGGFPEAIRHLLDDPDMSAAMADRARRIVEANYDWRILGRRMAKEISRKLNHL